MFRYGINYKYNTIRRAEPRDKDEREEFDIDYCDKGGTTNSLEEAMEKLAAHSSEPPKMIIDDYGYFDEYLQVRERDRGYLPKEIYRSGSDLYISPKRKYRLENDELIKKYIAQGKLR